MAAIGKGSAFRRGRDFAAWVGAAPRQYSTGGCPLGQLLRKQTEVLESRTLGAATDAEILEYEIRQEIIHEMRNQLANSDTTA